MAFERMKRLMTKAPFRLLLNLTLITVAAACAQPREDRFEQGVGIDLESVSAYQGKTFPLQTGDEMGAPNSTHFEQLRIDGRVQGVNAFRAVRYKTDAKLLGDVPIV